MTTEIWRDFDPNLDLPTGLKNVNVVQAPQEQPITNVPDATVVEELSLTEELDDDGGSLIDYGPDDILDPPGSLEVVSQVVRTAPDGRQVVDITIEVEDVPGALNYELRVTV